MACPHVAGAAAILLASGMSSKTVVWQLKARSTKGVVHDRKPGTPNYLLYIGRAQTARSSVKKRSKHSSKADGASCSEQGWSLASGPCVIDDDCCLQSESFPGPYGNDQTCTIQVGSAPGTITVESFQTEIGYDFLTVNGESFDGESGPENLIPKGTISWKSDSSETSQGFKLCLPDLGLQTPADKTETIDGKTWQVPDACVKPWTYGGKEIKRYCTMKDHHQPWCSQDETYDGNWLECTETE